MVVTAECALQEGETRMQAVLRTLVLLSLVFGSERGFGQSFYYQEPGNPSCPVLSAPTAVAPRKVQSGAPVPGSISVSCGFGNGSYTVTLSSTDPGATITPKTFLVNFGSIVGDGVFTVTFATVGVQTVSASITSNMGSPAVPGRFASFTDKFEVARP